MQKITFHFTGNHHLLAHLYKQLIDSVLQKRRKFREFPHFLFSICFQAILVRQKHGEFSNACYLCRATEIPYDNTNATALLAIIPLSAHHERRYFIIADMSAEQATILPRLVNYY